MIVVVESGTTCYAPDHGAYMPRITPFPNSFFIASQHASSGLSINSCRTENLRSPDGRQWHNEGQIADQCRNYSYRMPQIHDLPDDRLLMNDTRLIYSDM